MKKYKNGIDFVIVSYLPKGVEYCKLLVKSIHKYFEGVSYGINIVVNYTDKEDDIRVHKEIFDNDELVSILEGVDQTESQQLSSEGSLHHHGSDRFGKIDNNKTCLGSYYGVWGTNIGIKKWRPDKKVCFNLGNLSSSIPFSPSFNASRCEI